MALILRSCLILLLLIAASQVGASDLSFLPSNAGECRGTIAECLAASDEFEMSSEVSRRMLYATRYISYAALRRGSIPCSHRGASYYNCRPGAYANPYSRGCSAITRCRS